MRFYNCCCGCIPRRSATIRRGDARRLRPAAARSHRAARRDRPLAADVRRRGRQRRAGPLSTCSNRTCTTRPACCAGRPGFAVTAVLIVALGIGATTAAFSVTDFVLIRPLPFPQPIVSSRCGSERPATPVWNCRRRTIATGRRQHGLREPSACTTRRSPTCSAPGSRCASRARPSRSICSRRSVCSRSSAGCSPRPTIRAAQPARRS